MATICAIGEMPGASRTGPARGRVGRGRFGLVHPITAIPAPGKDPAP